MKSLLEYHEAEESEPGPAPLSTEQEANARDALLELLSKVLPLPMRDPRQESSAQRKDSSAQLDLACQQLCSAYSNSSPLLRAHVRSSIDSNQSWVLVEFAHRCAQLAQRSRNADVLHCGLVALAVAGLRHGDARDTLILADALYKASVALSVDPENAFLQAGNLAGPTIAELLLAVTQARSP